MNQITIDDYIKQRSMVYASKCRHCAYNYCYILREEPKECPCKNYEMKKSCYENGIPCTGQTKKYKGLSKCFSEGTGCYRHCYNEDVLTKNIPDKYEPSK